MDSHQGHGENAHDNQDTERGTWIAPATLP
jgi:hypothetical protein